MKDKVLKKEEGKKNNKNLMIITLHNSINNSISIEK